MNISKNLTDLLFKSIKVTVSDTVSVRAWHPAWDNIRCPIVASIEDSVRLDISYNLILKDLI